MESLISLLEAMERGPLDLQRCIQCNNWFIPYQRAQVTKFCSSTCGVLPVAGGQDMSQKRTAKMRFFYLKI